VEDPNVVGGFSTDRVPGWSRPPRLTVRGGSV
jgi:hypothetical protein